MGHQDALIRGRFQANIAQRLHAQNVAASRPARRGFQAFTARSGMKRSIAGRRMANPPAPAGKSAVSAATTGSPATKKKPRREHIPVGKTPLENLKWANANIGAKKFSFVTQYLGQINAKLKSKRIDPLGMKKFKQLAAELKITLPTK